MADYASTTWVDDDGSGTVGTLGNATILNNIEAGVKDAAQNSKQRAGLGSRPAASSATKNWVWIDSATNDVYWCDGTSWYWVSGGAGYKQPVDVAATSNVSVSSAPATIDGVTLTSGMRVLLAGQTTASQNGIYTFASAGSALTRAGDANSGTSFVKGILVRVMSGTFFGGHGFTYTAASFPTIGTTALTFTDDALSTTLPGCRLFHSATQTLTSGATLTYAFDSETYDNDGMHDNVTNNSRITVTRSGIYVVTASLEIGLGTIAGTGAVQINHNLQGVGKHPVAADARAAYASTLGMQFSLTAIVRATAGGDYFDLSGFQNSGANATTIRNSDYTPVFAAQWIGA